MRAAIQFFPSISPLWPASRRSLIIYLMGMAVELGRAQLGELNWMGVGVLAWGTYVCLRGGGLFSFFFIKKKKRFINAVVSIY